MNVIQSKISRAIDSVLSAKPGLAADRDRADFEHAWRSLGYPDDRASKSRVFRQLAPWFAGQAARRDLTAALTRADHRDRLTAASALGKRQGRELARREHAMALTTSLDRRIDTAYAKRARLVPPGPVRLF